MGFDERPFLELARSNVPEKSRMALPCGGAIEREGDSDCHAMQSSLQSESGVVSERARVKGFLVLAGRRSVGCYAAAIYPSPTDVLSHFHYGAAEHSSHLSSSV